MYVYFLGVALQAVIWGFATMILDIICSIKGGMEAGREQIEI